MNFYFKLKHNFLNTFKEILVHHHGSLNFRAKIFALLIAADPNAKIENYIIVKEYALSIYKGDEKRSNLLVLSTKELVEKVKSNNGLFLDTLITNVQKELKIVPRYAHKIDIEALKPLLELSYDQDIISYQENILRFLEELKEETLQKYKKKKTL